MTHQIVVLDFETTGLSPAYARVIEVAAVIVDNGEPIGRMVRLMDPGHPVPAFIQELTGISSAMVAGMPSPECVMPELKDFIGVRPVVAHNASFDMRFLLAEMERAGLRFENPSLCTMRLSRRLIPDLRGYGLGNLVRHLGISLPTGESFHRALGDVMVTVELWRQLVGIVEQQSGCECRDHTVLQKIMALPKKKLPGFLKELRSAGGYEIRTPMNVAREASVSAAGPSGAMSDSDF